MSQEKGGLRQYSAGLLQSLGRDLSNKYYVLHNSNDPLILETIRGAENLHLIPKRYGSQRFYEKFITNFLRSLSLLLFLSKNKHINVWSYVNRVIRKYKIDIIHCPYQFTPFTSKAKLICTIHDVQSLIFPENFTAKERMERSITYLDYIRRADKVVVSYEHIKQDLIKYFEVESEKIMVVLMDMKKLWFEKYLTQKPLDISHITHYSKFLLYPANTWKHKNHINLIKSIELILESHREKIYIICSGFKTGFFTEIQSALQKSKIQEQIHFCGSLSEEELYAIYRNSHGVIVPTTYEAGSFPLMESILMDIPVICSNVTSLPETIGNSQLTFDPFDVNSIADKTMKFWSDENYHLESTKNNVIQAAKLKSIDPIPYVSAIYNSVS